MNSIKLKKVLIAITFIVCLFGIPTAFISRISSPSLWIFSISGLFFPLIITSVLTLLIIWILKWSKWALMPFFTLLICWQQIHIILPLRFRQEFQSVKDHQTLRILSWNVSRWDERNKQKRGGEGYRPLMLDFIESSGADILCLQEFFECTDPGLFPANIPALKQRGYPYYYFYPSSIIVDGKFQYGLCIFSKYPLVNSFAFENLKGEHSEGVIFADIVFKKNVLRVFNTHLESPGLNKNDYSNEGKLKLSRSVFSKLKNSYQLRNLQAEQAKLQIDNTPFPTIICADLGDVPNSYAYAKLKSGYQDAFLQKGSGLGRTISHLSPTLRIDYIFVQKKLKVKQFTTEQLPYSDHFPLITDIEIDTTFR
ncbi:MAG: endonuclease/exonuclease/phosphatase family protein [Lacibacter sp.]